VKQSVAAVERCEFYLWYRSSRTAAEKLHANTIRDSCDSLYTTHKLLWGPFGRIRCGHALFSAFFFLPFQTGGGSHQHGLWSCTVAMRQFVHHRSISIPLLKVFDPPLTHGIFTLAWLAFTGTLNLLTHHHYQP